MAKSRIAAIRCDAQTHVPEKRMTQSTASSSFILLSAARASSFEAITTSCSTSVIPRSATAFFDWATSPSSMNGVPIGSSRPSFMHAINNKPSGGSDHFLKLLCRLSVVGCQLPVASGAVVRTRTRITWGNSSAVGGDSVAEETARTHNSATESPPTNLHYRITPSYSCTSS